MPKLPDKRALGEPTMRPGGGVVTAKAFGAPYSAAEFGGDGGLGALGAGLKQLGAGIEAGEDQAEKDQKFAALTAMDNFTTEMNMERAKFERDMPAGADGFTQSWEEYSRPRYTEFYKSLPRNPKLLREFDLRLQTHENNQRENIYNKELQEQDRMAKFRLQERMDWVVGQVTPDNLEEMRDKVDEYIGLAKLHPRERPTMWRFYDKKLQEEAMRRSEAAALADPLDADAYERHRKFTFDAVAKGEKRSLARRRFDEMIEKEDGGSKLPEKGGNGVIDAQRRGSGGASVIEKGKGNLSIINMPSGARFSVATDHAERFKGALDDLEAAGVIPKADQSGGYANRNIRGTNTPSQHSFGRAIDINWTDNPRGAEGKIPADVARKVAEKWGLKWGGDWKNPDPMHFEVAKNAGPLPESPVIAQRGTTQFAGLKQKGGMITDVTPVELDPKTGEPVLKQQSTQAVAVVDPASTPPQDMLRKDSKGRMPAWYGEENGTMDYAGPATALPYGVRRASLNKVETARTQAINEIESDIRKLDANAQKGVAPTFEDVERLRKKLARSDDAFLNNELARVEHKAAMLDNLSKVPPEQAEVVVADIEAKARDANGQLRLDEGQIKNLESMRASINTNRTAIAKNNLQWGYSKGYVKLEALDFANPESIRKRMNDSDRMAAITGKEGLLFTEAEESRFKALVDKGGKPMLQVFAAITKETGDKAQGYLQQIAKTMPEAPWLGGLVLDAERTKSQPLFKAAEDAARGAELRHQHQKDGIKVPYLLKEDDPKNAIRDIVTNEYVDAFVKDPIGKQGLVQTAQLIYEARASSKGLTAYNETLWKESLRAAAGEHTVNGVKYGGVVHQTRSLFGGNAGNAIPVPAHMDQIKFLQVRDVLTQQDIEGTSWRDAMGVATTRLNETVSRSGAAPGQPTVAGVRELSPQPESDAQPYYGPVYDTGKALTVSDFRRAKLIAIGEGKYIMALGDPASDDPRLVKDGTGNNYVFDVNRFEDTLRKRRPDLYLDKEKKPVGMMKLGGPGSFSVGETASPVEKTLFGNEQSKTADHGMAAEAKEMDKAGRSPREIFETTGWFKSDGNKWKNEIDDSKSVVTKMPKPGQFIALGTFFKHGDLYAAYPHMETAEVGFFNKPDEPWEGQYDRRTGGLQINLARVKDESRMRQIILHEVEHKLRADGGQNLNYTMQNYYSADNPVEDEAYDVENRRDMSAGTRRINPPRTVRKSDPQTSFTTTVTPASKDKKK